MAALVCEVCRSEFPFHLYKTCYNCDKVICPSCTRQYLKHLDLMPHMRARVKLPFAKHDVCFRCYEELEREEEEKRNKKEEEEREEERRKEEEEKNPKFKCDLCTAHSNSERSYTWWLPLSFSECLRCGRTICSGCTRDVPDSHDVDTQFWMPYQSFFY